MIEDIKEVICDHLMSCGCAVVYLMPPDGKYIGGYEVTFNKLSVNIHFWHDSIRIYKPNCCGDNNICIEYNDNMLISKVEEILRIK